MEYVAYMHMYVWFMVYLANVLDHVYNYFGLRSLSAILQC